MIRILLYLSRHIAMLVITGLHCTWHPSELCVTAILHHCIISGICFQELRHDDVMRCTPLLSKGWSLRCIHTCVYVFMCITYTYIRACVCMYVCVYVRMYVYTCTLICMYVYVCTYVCIYMYTYMYVCMYVCVYMYTYM